MIYDEYDFQIIYYLYEIHASSSSVTPARCFDGNSSPNYNTRNLNFESIAGMEICRLMPQSLKETVSVLEELNEEGRKLKHVNHSYSARLSLTKAIVCYKNKSVSIVLVSGSLF